MVLSKLGAVELLPKLYQPVWLPRAVHDEVILRGLEQGYPDALVAQMAVQRGELISIDIIDSELPSAIQALPLGAGEKQTIHLALRNHADVVLLDDAEARHAAQALGLRVRGTLGVIVQAVKTQQLKHTEAMFLIQTIQSRDDIWIAEELCRRVLAKLHASNSNQ